ncbi:hypothetical protein E3H11_40075 [Bradyrhizobium brasilense]|nr:hypothetical protein [Bradyrhizobium brasilense]NLS74946.1 hypothetical protein [Bradyrhizobium brasilense]
MEKSAVTVSSPVGAVPPAVSLPTGRVSSSTKVSVGPVTVPAVGPLSWIVNTPVPTLIGVVTLSPSASVMVCTTCSRFAADRVSVAASSGLVGSECQILLTWVNVTIPVVSLIVIVK